MDITVNPGKLNGTVRAIPSKSQAHRALICAALADGPTFIECEGESDDINATAACLSALGTRIERGPGGYRVVPMPQSRAGSKGASPATPTDVADGGDLRDKGLSLPCGESGSTFRFMLPIVCALGQRASFSMKGRLPLRPLSPLHEELARHGCELSPQGTNPFHASGRLTPGEYSIDAGISSQFISGLLFALPLLEGDSALRLTGRFESFPYVGLTMEMMGAFGVHPGFDGAGFAITGNQKYRSPGKAHVEGDWSNAAFWLCAGAVGGGGVACTGLDLRSRQGDREVLGILERFGARVNASERPVSSVSVGGGKLRGIDIDAHDIPDLVPIIAVVAAAADGKTAIRNAGRLRHKESDRLAAVTAVLRGLGVDVRESEDGLLINGGKTLKGGIASSWGDHRIAMSAAIAATICEKRVEIRGAEAINKSYPGFFDDFRALGGGILTA